MTNPSQIECSLAPCTVRELLAQQARENPHRLILRFASGERYTATQLLDETRRLASALHKLGVTHQQPLLIWLPNCPLAVLSLLALNYLGAIYVPINTAYRGRLLEHVIHNTGASVMLADGRLIERLEDIDCGELRQLLIAGEQRLASTDLEQLAIEDLPQPDTDPAALDTIAVAPWDTQAVIYTSGTTGPSKGVLCSYRHLYTAALEFRHVGPFILWSQPNYPRHLRPPPRGRRVAYSRRPRHAACQRRNWRTDSA